MAENIQACNQMFGSIVFFFLLFIERLQTLKSCVNAVQWKHDGFRSSTNVIISQ